jgi:hypothetical protein
LPAVGTDLDDALCAVRDIAIRKISTRVDLKPITQLQRILLWTAKVAVPYFYLRGLRG